MGKASKWFRSILGLNKTNSHNQPSSSSKRRWSFVKYYREKDTPTTKQSTVSNVAKLPSSNGRQKLQHKDNVSVVERKRGSKVVDPNKHAISVVAATAAVVRLTSGSGRPPRETATHFSINNNSCRAREESAAVKIQSTFRGYLGVSASKRSESSVDGDPKLVGTWKGLKALRDLWDQSQYTKEYNLNQFLAKLMSEFCQNLGCFCQNVVCPGICIRETGKAGFKVVCHKSELELVEN